VCIDKVPVTLFKLDSKETFCGMDHSHLGIYPPVGIFGFGIIHTVISVESRESNDDDDDSLYNLMLENSGLTYNCVYRWITSCIYIGCSCFGTHFHCAWIYAD